MDTHLRFRMSTKQAVVSVWFRGHGNARHKAEGLQWREHQIERDGETISKAVETAWKRGTGIAEIPALAFADWG